MLIRARIERMILFDQEYKKRATSVARFFYGSPLFFKKRGE